MSVLGIIGEAMGCRDIDIIREGGGRSFVVLEGGAKQRAVKRAVSTCG